MLFGICRITGSSSQDNHFFKWSILVLKQKIAVRIWSEISTLLKTPLSLRTYQVWRHFNKYLRRNWRHHNLGFGKLFVSCIIQFPFLLIYKTDILNQNAWFLTVFMCVSSSCAEFWKKGFVKTVRKNHQRFGNGQKYHKCPFSDVPGTV